jgi:hypothetical protein
MSFTVASTSVCPPLEAMLAPGRTRHIARAGEIGTPISS